MQRTFVPQAELMLNTFTQNTVIGIVRGYNWSSCSSKMKTYFTLLNSDSMTSACTERLTAVTSEHISELSTSALLCHYLHFVFHREIQSHFHLTNKCVILYLQALQKMRSLTLPYSGILHRGAAI